MPQASGSWAERLAEKASGNYTNEMALRQELYTVFQPYLTQHLNLDPSAIRHEGTSTSGRFDSMFGRVLIEYKAPGELATVAKRTHHAGQAIGYLRDEGIGADIVILTDGATWGILRDSAGPDEGEQGWLEFEEPLPQSDYEAFQWRGNSVETAQRVLDLLDTVRTVPINTNSLGGHLGPYRAETRALLAALADALVNRTTGSRTDILFDQWLALAGVSYGIGSADAKWPSSGRDAVLETTLASAIPECSYAETVFTLHTYVAYASKIIASEMLALANNKSEIRPSQWPSLSKSDLRKQMDRLESGQTAEALNAPGLMGGDLFGWYVSHLDTDTELNNALRGSLRAFAGLAWARLAHTTNVTGDLLRDFYSAVIPRKMRKALGEFFTPEWMAERVMQNSLRLMEAETGDRLRILDPSCGSGTFLVTALRRALRSARERGLDRAEQTADAIACVYGLDINPVSPLMTRVNLLLTLGDRVEDLASITFHVYQADSILIPEEHNEQLLFEESGADLRVPLVIGNITMPASLANLDAIGAFARVTDQSIARDRDAAKFAQRLRGELSAAGMSQADMPDALAAATRVYERIQELHSQGKDGIWAHVIEQSFAPLGIRDVDLVIGNPPWISWKELPQAWQDRSEPVWRQWGLWQTKRRGKGVPMSDISTLLLARSLATYSPHGLVSLLVPEGILINEPGGRAIRKSALGDPTSDCAKHPFKAVYVDDFSSLKPFADAANTPIAIYLRSGEQPEFPFPATKWTRAVARASIKTHETWREVRPRLAEDEHTLTPLDASDVGSRWRRPRGESATELPLRSANSPLSYTWGQGFHTRGADGIFYCQVTSASPLPGGLVRVKTRPDLGRNTKDLPSEDLVIEAALLWPLLRGRDVNAFNTADSGLHCIVPHKPGKLSSILKVDELIEAAPRTYDYLEQHLARLKGRSAYDMEISDTRPWGIQGTAWRYLRADATLVVARYMHALKMPPAAVCLPEHRQALGRSTTVYPNNKVNFVACNSAEEADYVCAIVNSGPAQQAIARQCSSTTIGPNAMNALPIPKFDAALDDHVLLSALGAQIRTGVVTFEDAKANLATLATAVCVSD